MWAHLVVVLAPGLDDDLRLGSAAEPLEAQALVAEFASRRIATICSSVNLDLRIDPSDSEGSLSSISWSENPEAGQRPYILGYAISMGYQAHFRPSFGYSRSVGPWV